MASGVRLVGDIGGTNARFALVAEERGYHSERVFPCAGFSSPEEAIRRYLSDLGVAAPEMLCIAAAGPIVAGRCTFTNSPWQISEDSLRREFRAEVALINDFAAIAYGLPALAGRECLQLGPVHAASLDRDTVTAGVLGPGTGLGAAGYLRRGGVVTPLVSEAGHMGFAPENDLQRSVQQCLARRFRRVSCERILSGSGLENLFEALAELHGRAPTAASAADIFAQSQADESSLARRATDVFFEVLGQVAGDLALALGAEDGMYIAGGIARRYPGLLQASRFRAGFENKGRHAGLLGRVPTLLIEHPHPGLFGAAALARTVARS